MQEHNIRKLCTLLGIDSPAKASGGWLVTSCPFAAETHAKGTDRNPSFRIHAEPRGRSGYHCFSCGAKGDLVMLATRTARLNGHSPWRAAAAAECLEEQDSLPPFDETEDECARMPEILDEALYHDLYPCAADSRQAVEYLAKRGVTRAVARSLGLRYDPEHRRVMFPVKGASGELYGYAGRSVDDKAVAKTWNYPPLQKAFHLLGLERATPGRTKVVVEGQFAYATLIQKGVEKYADVVALMGAKMSEAQANTLASDGCKVLLLLDDDLAGRQGLFGRHDAARQTYKGGGACDMLDDRGVDYCVAVYPPEAHGDPDNLTLSHVQHMLSVFD